MQFGSSISTLNKTEQKQNQQNKRAKTFVTRRATPNVLYSEAVRRRPVKSGPSDQHTEKYRTNLDQACDRLAEATIDCQDCSPVPRSEQTDEEREQSLPIPRAPGVDRNTSEHTPEESEKPMSPEPRSPEESSDEEVAEQRSLRSEESSGGDEEEVPRPSQDANFKRMTSSPKHKDESTKHKGPSYRY